MVNSDFGPAFILGIALILSGVALYGMRSFRPELSRDHDIFFAAIALVSGLILMFQGWRLDPLLFLGQLSLAGSAAFFAFENIRLRGVTTEQAKRSTPIVDDDRPVSRQYAYDYDYEAELDELPSTEQRRSSRRIPAVRDVRSAAFEDYPAERRGRRSYGESRRRVEPEEDYRASYPSESQTRRRLPRSRRPDDDIPVESEATWDVSARNVSARPEKRTSRDDWGTRPSQVDRASWDVGSSDVDVKPIRDVPEVSAAPEGGSTYRSSGKEPKSLSRYRSRRSSRDEYSPGRRSDSQDASAGYADYQPMNPSDEDMNPPQGYGDRYR